MHWYLIRTKPRQECCALQNLEQQGYSCYLPMLAVEKLRQGALEIINEPLFPRYLFVRLGQGDSARSWAPIRSTRGVNCLVSFGNEPARINDGLIERLRVQEALVRCEPEKLFKSGDGVQLAEAPFAGIEVIYQLADGEQRVMVLIEMLGRQVTEPMLPDGLRKTG